MTLSNDTKIKTSKKLLKNKNDFKQGNYGIKFFKKF
jgi:hypothetical protein